MVASQPIESSIQDYQASSPPTRSMYANQHHQGVALTESIAKLTPLLLSLLSFFPSTLLLSLILSRPAILYFSMPRCIVCLACPCNTNLSCHALHHAIICLDCRLILATVNPPDDETVEESLIAPASRPPSMLTPLISSLRRAMSSARR